MTSNKFENLAGIGELKSEPPHDVELVGLKRSGIARLADAERVDLSFESRFDLAYNAAHALALYALRQKVTAQRTAISFFSCSRRRLVYPPATGACWQRHMRNAILRSMKGTDERLLADVLAATRALVDALFSIR